MKKDVTLVIKEISTVSPGCVLIKAAPADGIAMPDAIPGQFVNIKVPDTDGVFLRRPISICDFTPQCITLFIKDAGRGTHTLCSLKAGDTFEALMPLGNGFNLTPHKGRTLLIGGGVGIAPLLYAGKKLAEAGANVEFLLGGASAADLNLSKEFEKVGSVHLTTVDGSLGRKGFVTDHEAILSPIDEILCCGPTPMMKAIAQVARQRNILMQASLENKMACGLGACLCCVEDTQKGHLCVCTDGPVFTLDLLKW